MLTGAAPGARMPAASTAPTIARLPMKFPTYETAQLLQPRRWTDRQTPVTQQPDTRHSAQHDANAPPERRTDPARPNLTPFAPPGREKGLGIVWAGPAQAAIRVSGSVRLSTCVSVMMHRAGAKSIRPSACLSHPSSGGCPPGQLAPAGPAFQHRGGHDGGVAREQLRATDQHHGQAHRQPKGAHHHLVQARVGLCSAGGQTDE
jgi:hypothetical protein